MMLMILTTMLLKITIEITMVVANKYNINLHSGPICDKPIKKENSNPFLYTNNIISQSIYPQARFDIHIFGKHHRRRDEKRHE